MTVMYCISVEQGKNPNFSKNFASVHLVPLDLKTALEYSKKFRESTDSKELSNLSSLSGHYIDAHVSDNWQVGEIDILKTLSEIIFDANRVMDQVRQGYSGHFGDVKNLLDEYFEAYHPNRKF